MNDTIKPVITGSDSKSDALPTHAPDETVPALVELTAEEYSRYNRHLILPEVGPEGQRKLKSARALIVGTGGLGAPAAMYLAAAGVGHLGLVDFDEVDASNLQRQIIHGTSSIGISKTSSAKARLNDINPNVDIELYDVRLSSENALQIISAYDLVIDATDNFPTRYLVNDACVLLDKPNVYGSVFRFEGQASVFGTKDSTCYRCLYPTPPMPGTVPSCAEGGVLGVLPGIIGSIQANEAIKLILGKGETLVNRLLLFDAWQMKFREIKINRDPKCPICGEHPSIRELIDYEAFCGITKAETATKSEISATELKRLLDAGNDLQLLDVREQFEFEIARIPDAKLIPFGEIVSRIAEIDPNRRTVVICKRGIRSAKAIALLKQAGFKGVLMNLSGGIISWSIEVDASVPQY